MYRGVVSVRKVSVLAANLPRGSAVGVRLGGGSAVTEEVEAAWLVENALYRIAHGQAGGKGKAPEMRDYPLGVLEMAKKQDYAVSRAEAFRRKHHASN
ncbi:hypothetical protein D6T65_04980 [Arthrobacter frigidicola]|nr:hypothetical protein D6T65_04980 [Arthrobacter frigidicola]